MVKGYKKSGEDQKGLLYYGYIQTPSRTDAINDLYFYDALAQG